MSRKTKETLNVLYIDDEVDDYHRLEMEANPFRIVLTHKTNLEEGIKTFKDKKGAKFFDGIILDALCLINKEDNKPTEGYIIKDRDEFQALAPSLLKVIFTGETALAHDLHKFLKEADVHIFNKGNRDDVTRMLKMFVDESPHKQAREITRSFADVFEIVEEYLGSDAKEELISCIKDMDSSTLHTIKGNLSCLRSVLEKMFFSLHEIDEELIPQECFINEKTKRAETNFASIRYHLNGRYDGKSHQGKIYIGHESNIDRQLILVYRGCSEGIHAIKENEPVKPTKYTVQSITYALLDLILWMKDIIKKNRH